MPAPTTEETVAKLAAEVARLTGQVDELLEIVLTLARATPEPFQNTGALAYLASQHSPKALKDRGLPVEYKGSAQSKPKGRGA